MARMIRTLQAILSLSQRERVVGLSLVLLIAPAAVLAAEGPVVLPPQLQGVGFDQRLNGQIPLELTFTDETGREVRLGDYFGSKPVILVLAYYECPMLCTLVLNGLVQGMLEMPFSPGKEFNVVTVSIDPREDWHLAASKKETYLHRLGKPGAENGWHFLTGQEEAIKQLADAAGFRYRFDPAQNQFIHAAGIMVLTPHGKISRYLYGVDFPGRDLRLGLVEASQEKIGTPVDQVLLYCFHYDATLGKYTASVMNFIRAGGVLTMLAVGAFVVFLRRQRNAVLARAAALEANDRPATAGRPSEQVDKVARGAPDEQGVCGSPETAQRPTGYKAS